jgi:membrane dipeptidase
MSPGRWTRSSTRSPRSAPGTGFARIGVIYGFQNAAQVGEAPERTEVFGDLGVRVVQLTYNPANQIGDGAMAPQNRGLTELGREVVARLNARRMMVDLSHSGERTCLEATQASTAPVSINHTGCRALCDLPRNKTDAELRGVAQKGGFIGIYFMPFLAPTARRGRGTSSTTSIMR